MALKSIKRDTKIKMLKYMSWWPPFVGAGIRVVEMAPDMTYIKVQMPLRFYNKNFFKVHYGGSLYSMADPFYMLMFVHLLGPDFIVWDKAASIEFVKPGQGIVEAEFKLTKEQVDSIKSELQDQSKILKDFNVLITNSHGETVAKVTKTLYFRKK